MPTGRDTSGSGGAPPGPGAGSPSPRLTAAGIDRQLGRVGRARRKTGVARRFGANLKRWRTRRGLTQQALAEAIGHDRSTIWHWEAGQRTPPIPDLLALASALGCEPAALLAGLRIED